MSIGDIILALIVAAVVFFTVRSVFVKKSVGCSLRSSYAPLTRCRKALSTLRAPAYKSKTEVSLGFLLYLRRREPFLRSVAWRTSA